MTRFRKLCLSAAVVCLATASFARERSNIEPRPGFPPEQTPLRRTLNSSSNDPVFDLARIAPESVPQIFGRREKQDILLEAAHGSPKGLEALGFQKRSPARMELKIAASDCAKFEASLVKTIESAETATETARKNIESFRPGAQAGYDEKSQRCKTGKLIYTGHPLDIALRDCGNEPHLFIAVGDPDSPPSQFIRGGRAYVADDGTFKIESFAPRGNWAKVPRDAERLQIRKDGRVLCTTLDGRLIEIGRIQVFRVDRVAAAKNTFGPLDNQVPDLQLDDDLVLAGHLEFPSIDLKREFENLQSALNQKQLAENAAAALVQATSSTAAANSTEKAAAAPKGDPIIVHAQLPWAEAHFRALNISVERMPDRTVIGTGAETPALVTALGTVLEGLRLKMSLHEQNLRNAEKIRDAENQINPWRRKVVKVGPQGEAVEALDPAPFPKTYKPGDPNADVDGNVILPNVNKAVETTEFSAAIVEYRLLRAALERLAPRQIFPEPPALPAKIGDGQ